MIITDPKMEKKMLRALKQGQSLYDLDDIDNALKLGNLQSHVIGDTVAITRVNDWPQRRSVDVVFVVGHLDEALKMDQKLVDWARSIGANLMTAVGRSGWHKYDHGWKRIGTLYAKDI